ncbi:hypothetical protein L207DRAFT_514011 [Hyaloscypha variabilis F]|uniref:Autophagy-related protein 14 n=1 Tax=Hyaloscypha variabilis (strain UAMH 11265 / GT02V1 / F) TaxID=1149755 RepID=A0A2J6RHW0_HYAVF|nr:hypothetical protein L207DRAFT_514011 [Hyaloscypha variabilis F]
MQCDICFRTGGSRLPFLCPTDARNRLYEPRIQNAQVLLEKDALDQQISSVLSPPAQLAEHKSHSPESRPNRPDIAALYAERDQTADRTQQIITQADELRAKVESARDDIAKKKAFLARRRSDLASAINGVDSRRSRQVEDAEKGIRMTKYKWNSGHATTAASRAFLCGEAAKLYGLKRARRNGGLEEYRIGGVNIVDLRTMNTASPAQISTALSHIVHLLMLSTHYLAIRLPAEVTLPHRDYPLPTIFNLTSSYKHADVPFPGITGQSSNTSPTASRQPEQPNQPRPRPLFITKPLPLLATEDPSGYGLFLEGVTLLAYDVAWVCKSQGIPVGEDSKEPNFEDICNIGKNLYNLLLGSRPRPAPPSRVPSAQSTPTKSSRDTETETEDRKKVPAATIGQYSHGSAHSFLGTAEGTYFIRSWKLPNPMKLAGELKSKLMSEVANAEWEVLDQDAWQVEDEMGDDGVVVGARKEGERAPGLGMQSFMSMRTVMDAVEMVSGDGARKPGTSGTNGWTKLKPR